MTATTDLARRIRLDVSPDSTNWTQILGITDLNFPITPTKVDTTTYDTLGWKGMTVTLQEWAGTIKLNRQSTSGVQDPGQLLLTGCVGQFDPLNRLYVRWYDRNGKAEPSWSGYAIVEQAQDKTGVGDEDSDSFSFTGDGAATAIANPYAASAVPVITSALPGSLTTGGLLAIHGSNFTGVTGASHVTIGGTNATAYTVQSDQLIIAVLPSGSAGSAPIIVTNVAGASASFAYTRT